MKLSTPIYSILLVLAAWVLSSLPSRAEIIPIPRDLASDDIQVYEPFWFNGLEAAPTLQPVSVFSKICYPGDPNCYLYTDYFALNTLDDGICFYNGTTGVWLFLTLGDCQSQVELDTLGGRGHNPEHVWSFAIPVERLGHVFALETNGEYSVVNKGPAMGRTIPDANGNPVWEDWGFFNAHATATAIAPTLIDLTAHESAPAGLSNTVGATWTTNWTVPIASVQVIFPDQASTYTLHTSTGFMQSLTALMDGNSQFSASAAVAWGEAYWVTRDIDGVQSPSFSSPYDLVADLRSSMHPYVARDLVTQIFHIGDERHGHELVVVHGDGYASPLYFYGTNYNYLQYWDDDGNEQHYTYSLYTAQVDSFQQWSWHVVDETTGENLGQNFDIFTGYPTEHDQQPGVLSFILPNSREGHALHLIQENGETWNVGLALWHDSNFDYTFYGTPQERWYQMSFYEANAPYNPNGGSSYYLEDATVREATGSFSLNSSPPDLRQWYLPYVPLQVKMNASRWNNRLVLVQPNERSDITDKGSLQGSYQYTFNGLIFEDKGYYTPTTQIHPDAPWWIWDATRMEYLQPSPGDPTDFRNCYDGTDTDGDGLPDWWEFARGLNPNSGDTDQDGISDYNEIVDGYDPLAKDNPLIHLTVTGFATP